jgi:hypothetical protein
MVPFLDLYRIKFVSDGVTSAPITNINISSYDLDIDKTCIPESLFEMFAVHDYSPWCQSHFLFIEILKLIGIVWEVPQRPWRFQGHFHLCRWDELKARHIEPSLSLV